MGVENIGDILHIIILTLILVWLFYHQWVITKLLDLMRQITDTLPGNQKDDNKEDNKEYNKHNNRQDSDFQLKR